MNFTLLADVSQHKNSAKHMWVLKCLLQCSSATPKLAHDPPPGHAHGFLMAHIFTAFLYPLDLAPAYLSSLTHPDHLTAFPVNATTLD